MRRSGARCSTFCRMAGFDQSALAKSVFIESRGDGIDPDAFGTQFQREIAPQLSFRCFGNSVRAEHCGSPDRADARQKYDIAGTAFDHVRRHELGKPPAAFHVAAHDLVPRVILELHERAVKWIHGSIANQDIDPAVLVQRGLDERFDLFAAADVARDRYRFAAARSNLVANLVAGFLACAMRSPLWRRPPTSLRQWLCRCRARSR